MMTEEKKQEFETLSKQMIRFLCENCNPHTIIIIDPTSAELLSGEVCIQTEEFLND